MEIKADPYT